MRSLNFGIQSDRKSAGADLSVEYYNFPVAEIFEFKVDPVPKLTFLNGPTLNSNISAPS